MDTKATIELTQKDIEKQPLVNGTSSKSAFIYDCVWEWDMFGRREMVVILTYNTPLWRRIVTRILLGSKWKKL